MCEQIRLLLLVSPLVFGALAFCFIADSGGVSRDLLLALLRDTAIFGPMLAFAFVIAVGLDRAEIMALAATAAAIVVLRAVGLIEGSTEVPLFGVAAVGVLVPCAARGDSYGKARLGFVICGSVILVAALRLSVLGQELTKSIVPTSDAAAYVMDSAFGFNPSQLLGKLIWSNPQVRLAVSGVYGWLAIILAVCYALSVRAGNRGAGMLMKAGMLGGLVAFLLFPLFPAAGPLYLFGERFPANMPDPATLAGVVAQLANPDAPRNCMPSMHFTWALLAAFQSRQLGPVWCCIFSACAVVIAIATIATGEHYLIDLIVALPLALGLYAAFDADAAPRARALTVLACAACLTLWFAFLYWWRPGPLANAEQWAMTAVTLLGFVAIGAARFTKPAPPRSAAITKSGGQYAA